MEGRDKGPALHSAVSPGTGSSPDSCYDKHSDQNRLGEGMGLLDRVTVRRRWKPGQELKAETWRQELRQRPPRDAASWFGAGSYSAQDSLPGHGSVHNGLGPPT